MPKGEGEEREHWHLNKGVPVAIIVALGLQTVGWITSVTQMSSQVAQNKEDVKENKADIKAAGSTEPRLVRVETDITYIRRSVDDNKVSLQDLNNKLTELLRETRTRPRR